MKRAREIRASAPSTLGSWIPCARTWRTIAAPGAGSGGLGMGMVARLVALKVLQLQLNLAPPVPFVDRRVEDERAERVGRQRPGSFGQVPADHLDDRPPLRHAELEVVLPRADQ